MDNNAYIELNRQFVPIPEKTEFGEDYEDRALFGLAKKILWQELLEQHRVVILAEAGVGKTEEIRQTATHVRKSGKPAFFIRLEYLTDGIDGAFESEATGTYSEFQTWLSSDDDGWLFLDSVDEAKLESPRNFEKAIRILASALGDARQRAHIFITSRITEWRPKADLALVNEKLPYKVPQAVVVDHASEPLSDGVEDKIVATIDGNDVARSEEPAGDKSGAKIFSLAPLADEQVKMFAVARGVADGDKFLAAIDRNDAHVFASRPRDLLDLIGFWNLHGRVGTPVELIKSSIESKLREDDPVRAQLKPLSLDKAYHGARLLAAAATLLKEQRIAVPDRDLGGVGIVATTILRDWSAAECSTLLSRPMFDEAIYGTVRFHHRSVREYLTAEWLNDLLKGGNSRRQIENLFFKTQYGVPVIVPTMRPILPWLALMDERIRERAYRLAPESLLSGGDPAQFSTEFRQQIISMVCAKQDEESADHSFDMAAIQRFVRPDMGSAIKALLSTYASNRDNQRLLLRLVWQGGLSACLPEAFEVASDTTRDTSLRLTAIRAMAAFEKLPDGERMVAALLGTLSPTDHRILGELIENFTPRLFSLAQVLDTIESIDPPDRYDTSSLGKALTHIAVSSSPEDAFRLVQKIAERIALPPFIERRHFEVSERYAWLLTHAAKACEVLIARRHPLALTTEVLTIVSLTSLSQHYDTDYSDKIKFAELVPAWDELNHRLFWHDVAEARKELDDGKRLVEWWQARFVSDYWKFEARHFEQIAEDISSRPLDDDRLVALSLGFAVYTQNERPKDWLKRLKTAVSGASELEAALHRHLHPPKASAEVLKSRIRESQHKKRREQREERLAADRAKSSKWLATHIEVLRDVTLAPRGAVWDAQHYLIDRLRKLSKVRHRWGHGNWQDLIGAESTEIAQAFREGAVDYWRSYKPPLRSEGVEDPSSVPNGVVLGLCGLEIEANASDDWASKLSAEDAANACRYAFWEMNGFPSWMPKLFAAHRQLVRDMLIAEIEWEMRHTAKGAIASYVLSDIEWQGDWAKPELARGVLDCLALFDPLNLDVLRSCIKIVTYSDSISGSDIKSLAIAKSLAAGVPEQRAVWFSLWISVDAKTALVAVERHLSQIEDQDAATTLCMELAVNLIGKYRANLGPRQSFNTVPCLKSIFLLFHRFIRVEDDLNRGNTGVYSPTLRDNAQEARNQVFSMLQEIPGKDTYIALKELSEIHPVVGSRAWMARHALRRAETDADLQKWLTGDFLSFAESAERLPRTHSQLFELAVLRLLDLKDEIENGDDSIAAILLKVDGETVLRNYLGKWLRDNAKGRYAIPQEEELADAKRPDLRVHGMGFDAPLPIEFKIADNWTGPQLFERLENQLCNDYLRDARSDSGIFLLVYRGQKGHWDHPVSGQSLAFDELPAALQQNADNYIAKRSDIQAITVIGIDLTKRATALRFNTG